MRKRLSLLATMLLLGGGLAALPTAAQAWTWGPASDCSWSTDGQWRYSSARNVYYRYVGHVYIYGRLDREYFVQSAWSGTASYELVYCG